jgi:hypothetical protein
MKITKLSYLTTGKKKYNIIHNGKEYTCYICSCMPNLVVTGNGNTENFEDITNTNLGAKIMIGCYHAD